MVTRVKYEEPECQNSGLKQKGFEHQSQSVTVVVYILNSKDVQGVTLTMDRKYWLFGGITAAVISGAYVFWTSSSKSNKKKGKILRLKISYQYSNYFISSIYNMEN